MRRDFRLVFGADLYESVRIISFKQEVHLSVVDVDHLVICGSKLVNVHVGITISLFSLLVTLDDF